MEDSLQGWRRDVLAGAIVFAVVLAACLFGILTRPLGFLAAFWPANAVLLGLFVRFPWLASPVGWIAAIVGYLAADLLTGGAFALTIWLTTANLAGVVVGVIIFALLGDDDRALRRPLSVLYFFGIVICAACASAVVGAGAAPVFFGRNLLSGAAFWFTTELVNSIIVVPVILTAPRRSQLALWLQRLEAEPAGFNLRRAAPFAALAVSLFAGFFVDGVGHLAFPSPALLWCALVYPMFPTVLLTSIVSIWHLLSVSQGFSGPHIAQIDETTMSDRLGIMLLALGPLTVASINAARVELTRKLAHLATHDALTGTLTRAGFATRAESIVSAATEPFAILMLDIDHFKSINDTHGHTAGDNALAGFAHTVARSLRKNDLFGRLGGEEFVILLPQVSSEGALDVAERLRSQVENFRSPLPNGQELRFTVSIGLVHLPAAPSAKLESLLTSADEVLYRAKGEGRNRVVCASYFVHSSYAYDEGRRTEAFARASLAL